MKESLNSVSTSEYRARRLEIKRGTLKADRNRAATIHYGQSLTDTIDPLDLNQRDDDPNPRGEHQKPMKIGLHNLPNQFRDTIQKSRAEHKRYFEAAINERGFGRPSRFEDIKALVHMGKPKKDMIEASGHALEIGELKFRLARAFQALEAQGKKPKGFLIYMEGSDAVGKSSTGSQLVKMLESLGYNKIQTSFRAPSAKERSEHWLQRFYRHLPQEGEVALWDRGPAGDPVYGGKGPAEFKTMSTELADLEATAKKQGIFVFKVYLHSSPKKQAAVLGKRIARGELAKRYGTTGIFDESMTQLSPNDFRAIENFANTHSRFSDFVGMSGSETAWNTLNTDNRSAARVDLLRAFCNEMEMEAQKGLLKKGSSSMTVKHPPQPTEPKWFMRKAFLKLSSRSVNSVLKDYTEKHQLNDREKAELAAVLRSEQIEKTRTYWGGVARDILPAKALDIGISIGVAAALGVLVPLLMIPLSLSLIFSLGSSYWLVSRKIDGSLERAAEKYILNTRGRQINPLMDEASKVEHDNKFADFKKSLEPVLGRLPRLRQKFARSTVDGIIASYAMKGVSAETLFPLKQKLDMTHQAKGRKIWHVMFLSKATVLTLSVGVNIAVAGLIGGFGWPVVALGITGAAIGLLFYAVLSHHKIKSSLDAKARAHIAQSEPTMAAKLVPQSGLRFNMASRQVEDLVEQYTKQYFLTKDEAAKLRKDLEETMQEKLLDYWQGRPAAHALAPLVERGLAAAISSAFGLSTTVLAVLGISAAVDSLTTLFQLYRKMGFTLRGVAHGKTWELLEKRQLKTQKRIMTDHNEATIAEFKQAALTLKKLKIERKLVRKNQQKLLTKLGIDELMNDNQRKELFKNMTEKQRRRYQWNVERVEVLNVLIPRHKAQLIDLAATADGSRLQLLTAAQAKLQKAQEQLQSSVDQPEALEVATLQVDKWEKRVAKLNASFTEYQIPKSTVDATRANLKEERKILKRVGYR